MSRCMRYRVLRATFPCVVALLLLACTCCIAWAADATATIVAPVRVFQEYRVSASGLQSTFDYRIVPLETGAPLPVDESGESFDTFSLKRDQELMLEFPVEVSYSESAASFVYHYMLKPANEKLADGLYYVDLQSTSLEAGVNVYYLELHVQLSSTDAASATVTPTVHVEGWDGPKVTDPGWRVSYKKPSESEESGGSGQTGGSGQSSTTGGTSSGITRTSGGPLSANTGDLTTWSLVAAYAICGALLIVSALVRRRMEGDGHA